MKDTKLEENWKFDTKPYRITCGETMRLSPGLRTLCLNHRSIISIYFKGVFVPLLLLLVPLFQQMPCLTDGGNCSISNFPPRSILYIATQRTFWGKKSCLRIGITKSLGHSQGLTFISVMCIPCDVSSHISPEKPSV